MQVIDLFTGIGGFSLAAREIGWDIVQQCELNNWCRRLMNQNFPGVPMHDDVYTLKGENIIYDKNKPVIVVGGFPCQSFSVAGRGKLDLSLWKQMYRIIHEVAPDYIVAENVPGIVSRQQGVAFRAVCADMEAAGYHVIALNLPAAGTGAPHQRERIWFVAANTCSHGFQSGRLGENRPEKGQSKNNLKERERIWDNIGGVGQQGDVANTDGHGLQGWGNGGELRSKGEVRKQRPENMGGISRTNWENFPTESPVCGGDARISKRMDRIKGLGNAIQWEVAYEIFKAIEATR